MLSHRVEDISCVVIYMCVPSHSIAIPCFKYFKPMLWSKATYSKCIQQWGYNPRRASLECIDVSNNLSRSFRWLSLRSNFLDFLQAWHGLALFSLCQLTLLKIVHRNVAVARRYFSEKNRLESNVCQSGLLALRQTLSICFTKYVKGPDNGD